MSKCPVCGKSIPKNVDYCSKECKEKHKQLIQEKQRLSFLTQFDKGSGSYRREKNIRKIAELLRDGVSEDEIRFRLSLSFKSSTVDDYLRTAKELLRREGNERE